MFRRDTLNDHIYHIYQLFLSFFVESPNIVLVRISFDGNNTIEQQCDMDDGDCERIAQDASIQYASIIDMFYNNNFKFDEYESNKEAAKQLKLFCSKPLEEKVGRMQRIKQWCNWFF